MQKFYYPWEYPCKEGQLIMDLSVTRYIQELVTVPLIEISLLLDSPEVSLWGEFILIIPLVLNLRVPLLPGD
jgi:hypothetical protein